MAKYRVAFRALLGFIIFAGVAVGATRMTAGETPKKIRIIYTNDMRGEWIPCG